MDPTNSTSEIFPDRNYSSSIYNRTEYKPEYEVEKTNNVLKEGEDNPIKTVEMDTFFKEHRP